MLSSSSTPLTMAEEEDLLAEVTEALNVLSGPQEDPCSWLRSWPVVYSFSGVVLALSLLASHPANEGTSAIFVADALAVVIYVALGFFGATRLARYCWKYMPPVVTTLTWLLTFLLSFSAPERRRALLMQTSPWPGTAIEYCEESSAALWITMLLVFHWAAVKAPPWHFTLLGQVCALQHLIIGLAVPRKGCVDQTWRGGTSLGLPPIWVPSFQISLIVATLSFVQAYRSTKSGLSEKVTDFIFRRATVARERTSLRLDDGGGVTLKSEVERAVEELEEEERCGREFLGEIYKLQSNTTDIGWVAVVAILLDLTSRSLAQLKQHGGLSLVNVGQGSGQSPEVPGWMADAWTMAHMAGSKSSSSDHGAARKEARVPGRSWSGFPSVSEEVPLQEDEAAPEPEGLDGRRSSSSSECVSSNPFCSLASVIAAAKDLGVGDWSFDALKVRQEQPSILKLVGAALVGRYDIVKQDQLLPFLEVLEGCYISSNPYHSNAHAADMVNSFWMMMTKSGFKDKKSISDNALTLSLIAGLGHDVGHLAKNNLFMINSRHELAVRYNDRSVMESHHASVLVSLLQKPYGSKADQAAPLFSYASVAAATADRQFIIHLILSTDTQKHLEDLAVFRLKLATESFNPVNDSQDQLQTIALFFRAADIAHSAKPWTVHEAWSLKVVQEFHEQGDEELRLGLPLSPLCSREGFELNKSQAGFLQFICIPTWAELKKFEELLQKAEDSVHSKTSRSQAPSRETSRKVTWKVVQALVTDRTERRAITLSGSGEKPKRTLAARGKFLTDPSVGKVAPLDVAGPDQSPATQLSLSPKPFDFPEWAEEPAPPRFLATFCLENCERNYRTWKERADVVAKSSPPEGPILVKEASKPPAETSRNTSS